MTLSKIDNFAICREIAQNPCFAVYEAVDEKNGGKVHLRVLSERYRDDRHTVEHFKETPRVFRYMDTSHVYRVLDYRKTDDQHYLVSEAVDFDPLEAIVQAEHLPQVTELAEVFIHIAKALQKGHLSGQFHGFLNPGNIYLNAQTEVKIDDFGFSWMVPELTAAESETARYLARYIAPDFHNPEVTVDGRADIYSLGIILYEILSGAPPFDGTTVAEIQNKHRTEKLPVVTVKNVSHLAQLGDILKRCLRKDPEGRFHNLKEFIRAFEDLKAASLHTEHSGLLNTNGVKTGESGKQKSSDGGRGRRTLKFVLFALLIIVLSALGGILYLQFNSPPASEQRSAESSGDENSPTVQKAAMGLPPRADSVFADGQKTVDPDSSRKTLSSPGEDGKNRTKRQSDKAGL